MEIRYVNDLGNGHSGYATVTGVPITNTSGVPFEVTNTSGIPLQITAAGTTAGDSFGRLRVSNPLTLFDSSNRYTLDSAWSSSTATGGTVALNTNQGLVDLAVTTSSGSRVYRETNRVFPYQPGKSLLVMSTFVMASGAANLRQRVGFFGTSNGVYCQLSGATFSFVKRSSVSGSVVDTAVPQSSWNVDKLDGSGLSELTLDPTKAQIFWADFEWLGVGTVRTGFVINGKFILCHTFDHANIISTTYVTTATLPLRYEIEALGTLGSAATLKQICSTVVSEGGYQLEGTPQSIGTPLSTPRTFTASGTFYPVAALRLKTSPDRLDAVVIPTAISLLGQGNNAVFNWKIVTSGTVSGGSWTSAGTDSPVEYNLSGTSIVSGVDMIAGFVAASNQSQTALDITSENYFKYQLERNSFTSTPTEFILAVSSKAAADTAYAALSWEEIVK